MVTSAFTRTVCFSAKFLNQHVYVRDPQVSRRAARQSPVSNGGAFLLGLSRGVHLPPPATDHSESTPRWGKGDLMKQSTPLWVWLTFGLISLGIAAYAAVQDDIFAAPDLRPITEAARAIILGGARR